MTAPRNIRPDVTRLITRRTTRRHYLFTPDEEGLVEQLYWYTTAVFAQRFGIQLHMMQLLSSHLHEALTDTKGQLSAFFERRNQMFANALKVVLGWPEEVLAKEPANWVELPTAEAVVKEMAYTAANCVAAGLVRTPQRWPGAKVLVNEVGQRVVTVKRPDVYFDPNNPDWPDEVSIPIVMPKLLTDAYGSDDACREVLAAALDELLRKTRRDNQRTGRGYAGAKRVLKIRHTRRANSRETFGSRKPTFAAAGNQQVARACIDRRRTFLAAYRDAWTSWKAGDRTAVFPYGTWKMRIFHGAPCHSPPS
ncbi:MAG: transposase [bacterium]|nr:transposase [bacterium]